MKKLEKILELMENIKDPKALLNNWVDDILKKKYYKTLEKYDGSRHGTITFYGGHSSNADNKLFIKQGSDGNNLYKYCFAVLKEKTEEKMQEFYKRFKKRWDWSLEDAIVVVSGVSGCFGSLYLGAALTGLYENPLFFLGGLCGAAGTLRLSFGPLNKYFEKRLDKKVEESCKEIYYGKEALKKL